MTVIPITRKHGVNVNQHSRPPRTTVRAQRVQSSSTLLVDTPDPAVRREIANWLDALLPSGYTVGEPADPFGGLAIIDRRLNEVVTWVATPGLPSVAALRLPSPPKLLAVSDHAPLQLRALASFVSSRGVDKFSERPLPALSGELEEAAFDALEDWCARGAVGYMASLTPRGEFVFTRTGSQEMRRFYSASVRVTRKLKAKGSDVDDSAVLTLAFSLRPNYQDRLMDQNQVAYELLAATWLASTTN